MSYHMYDSNIIINLYNHISYTSITQTWSYRSLIYQLIQVYHSLDIDIDIIEQIYMYSLYIQTLNIGHLHTVIHSQTCSNISHYHQIRRPQSQYRCYTSTDRVVVSVVSSDGTSHHHIRYLEHFISKNHVISFFDLECDIIIVIQEKHYFM